jgi:hypothetical protein
VHVSPPVGSLGVEARPVISLRPQPVYLMAMRGRFSCGSCKIPAGARPPRGTVLRLTLTPGLLRAGFGLGPDYPEMRAAGKPLRLG